MDITFIVHSDWLENIKGLPQDQQDKIIAEMIRYGAEMPLQYEDDSLVSSFVNFVKGSIDFSKKNYQARVEAGKSKGRPKTIDNREIWRLAHDGMKAADIAAALGITKSSVDHSDGWKNRKNDEYLL